ncbi:MAG: iron ABC transporter substrate-binding protein [Rhodothermales bacterium]|nr:iron ABC transporter substrate-binding protein [Rhodothermales bacterium]
MYHKLVLVLILVSCGCTGTESDHLVMYSGRSKALVEPLVLKYQEQTGTQVDVRYGDTAQMAVALTEEGERTMADLFWAQDAGALGAVAASGLLSPLPDSLLGAVGPGYRGSGGTWIATSGRARTLAFSTARADTGALPRSVFDLVAPQYHGRVGWAPANGSFQAFVTAMRKAEGEERTRAWLDEMKTNGARAYSKNTAILQGIANGEIDFGLPNHYYLHRFRSEDPGFPVEQTRFESGDVGNLINVAGVGVLAASRHRDAARAFIHFVLSPESQAYFVAETFEYPVAAAAGSLPGGPDSLRPSIPLDDLRDLEQTLQILRDAGLL